MNTMTHGGYAARIEFDERDSIFVGRTPERKRWAAQTDTSHSRMLQRSCPLFAILTIAMLAGCTSVSPQTTVVSQAAAGAGSGGVGAAAGASTRALAQPTGELVPLETWNVVLVTAKSVPNLGEVRDISDAFTYEGRVFAHATFTARSGVHGGQPAVEVRWSNGDRLVPVQKAQPVVNKSPYYMASSTSGTALGVGACKVEYAVNGKIVAAKEFVVSEK